LARALIELVETHGEKRGNQHAIRFPLSHQDFAGLIGVSRETVTLTFGQLQAEGLIAVERRCVIVLDLDRLRQEGVQPADPPPAKYRTKTTPT
jgi:CRP/FNR family transcriptional regulator